MTQQEGKQLHKTVDRMSIAAIVVSVIALIIFFGIF